MKRSDCNGSTRARLTDAPCGFKKVVTFARGSPGKRIDEIVRDQRCLRRDRRQRDYLKPPAVGQRKVQSVAAALYGRIVAIRRSPTQICVSSGRCIERTAKIASSSLTASIVRSPEIAP